MNLALPPSEDFPYFLAAFGLILGVVALCEALKKFLNVSAKLTRKIVHISTGVFIFFAPFFFQSNVYPALIPALFIPFNLIAVRFGWLKSLHGDESDTATHALNYGTVYFPISFLLLTLLCWGKYTWILQTSMLVLGLGDALAALVGENLKKPRQYKFTTTKSIEGSLVMFIVSFLVLYGCLTVFKPSSVVLSQLSPNVILGYALALALVATAVEALLSGGMDNLFIPVAVAYLLYIPELRGAEFVNSIILGASISAAFARLSLGLKFLNGSGATTTFLLAANIFSMGGLVWTVPILTFFFLSSILSKVGKARKKKFDLIFEKGSERDMGQVLANGGVGWLLMIWHSFTTDPAMQQVIYFGYLGTMAAVQADTWATEIGTMMRNPKPHSIITFKPVPAGTSGGITTIGTLGGLLGALVICASAWLSNADGMARFGLVSSFVFVGASGLIGSLLDSIFGATLQAQYYDPIRDKITERTHSVREDGTTIPNNLIKGHHWMDNDLVNLICGITGAGTAMLFGTM